MKIKQVLTFSLSLLFVIQSKAQDKLNIKYGKIGIEDFAVNSLLVDANTNAIILADIGNTKFEGDGRQQILMVHKHHCRLLLINKNAFDLATIQIPLYGNITDQEKLEDMKAASYHIVEGKVVESSIGSKSVFTEKKNKNWTTKKFTLSDLRENTIIEYSYTIKSAFFFNLPSWQFQHEYPCLWSEYNVSTPEQFKYILLAKGEKKFDVTTVTNSDEVYHFSTAYQYENVYRTGNSNVGNQSFDIKSINTNYRWVLKNTPAFKDEAYISSIENYRSKVEFQLTQIAFEGQPVKTYMNDWYKAVAELRTDEDFGIQLLKPNNWLDDDVKSITVGLPDKISMAKKIYAFVRDNFTVTRIGYNISSETTLKDVFKKKTGSVAEINLLLIAMLKQAKIDAIPVISSLRKFGITHPVYPLLERYNYLVVQANIDGKTVYLDAATTKLGFDKLPLQCYNGHARAINFATGEAEPVYFETDSLLETQTTSVFISNNESNGMIAAFSKALGYYGSFDIRGKLSKTNQADFIKELILNPDFEISNSSIESINQLDEPITLKCDLKIKATEGDIIYFTPMLSTFIKENPYKSGERFYPIEMPYTSNESYTLNMEIPKGFVVDEMPKSTRVKLNEDDGIFEYIINKSGNYIQLHCKLLVKKANFEATDYQTLRDFYGFVVKKQSEQIVFKKEK